MKQFRWCWLFFTSLAVAVTSLGALAQPPAGPGVKGTPIQGRVIRVQAPNQFLVRTAENKEVILYVNPQTRYLLNNRAVQFTDLREGAVITALYEAADGRNVVSSVTFVEATPVPVEKPVKPKLPVEKKPAPVEKKLTPAEAAEESGKEIQINGMIASVGDEPSRVILATADGKGTVLYLDTKREVTVRYAMKGGKKVVTAIVFGEAPAPEEKTPATEEKAPAPGGKTPAPATKPPAPAEETAGQGTVVKVLEGNQLVVRLATGRELVLQAQPQTTYRFDDRPGQFQDLRAGMNIRFTYDMQDRKAVVRRIFDTSKGVK